MSSATMDEKAELGGNSAPRRSDPELRARGYCGAIDETGKARCYRRPGHHGPCNFSTSFQLCHPRLD